jgi:hypothetical protein
VLFTLKILFLQVGITQRQLAPRMDVSEVLVSGITLRQSRSEKPGNSEHA